MGINTHYCDLQRGHLITGQSLDLLKIICLYSNSLSSKKCMLDSKSGDKRYFEKKAPRQSVLFGENFIKGN